ncbi:hypothetical protein M1563_04930 [Patescibacteria group bacterium]|nr:hypothetical protein [Patescibacteria group bacterium]MCL5409454.1 hypothetical protein [Patescibacteria group bacterium]
MSIEDKGKETGQADALLTSKAAGDNLDATDDFTIADILNLLKRRATPENLSASGVPLITENNLKDLLKKLHYDPQKQDWGDVSVQVLGQFYDLESLFPQIQTAAINWLLKNFQGDVPASDSAAFGFILTLNAARLEYYDQSTDTYVFNLETDQRLGRLDQAQLEKVLMAYPRSPYSRATIAGQLNQQWRGRKIPLDQQFLIECQDSLRPKLPDRGIPFIDGMEAAYGILVRVWQPTTETIIPSEEEN